MENISIPVTAPMPAELEQRARIEAARQRISRAEFVRRAVEMYLQPQQSEPQLGTKYRDGQCDACNKKPPK